VARTRVQRRERRSALLRLRRLAPARPANDGGEHASAVAVELRAAEIAADWRDQNYTPGCDRFDWCPATCTDELCSTCGSLYLAHYHVKDDGP
jgi:hypothetical protein